MMDFRGLLRFDDMFLSSSIPLVPRKDSILFFDIFSNLTLQKAAMDEALGVEYVGHQLNSNEIQKELIRPI